MVAVVSEAVVGIAIEKKADYDYDNDSDFDVGTPG
jgi:hypothetical protein